MTLRKDVIDDISTKIAEKGIYPRSLQERHRANGGLGRARRNYEKSRGEMLAYDLSMFYRVAIFGSARLDTESPDFYFIRDLSRSLVEARDVDIITGGGPGIMKAANFGVRLAIEGATPGDRKPRSKSLGETIILPNEQSDNGHLDYSDQHPEFSTRLQAFVDKSRATYNAKGGIGTLFEMLLMLQSRQVGHLEDSYPILADPYWEPIVNVWNEAMYHSRVNQGLKPLIGDLDLNLIRFSNKIPEIVDCISANYDLWHLNIRSKVRIIR